METDSKLINQGSYGCIYYPSLPFQLQRDKKNPPHNTKTATATATANQEVRSKYVSKLQKFNFHSDFEDHIGRKIQEIPSYDLFFVPVLKTYKIDLATIKESHVTGCDAISKYIRRNTKSKSSESRQQHLTPNDYKKLNKHFIIQKMKYINGMYLHRYLLGVINNTDDSTPEKIIMSSSSSDSEASDHDHDRQLKTQLTKTMRRYREEHQWRRRSAGP